MVGLLAAVREKRSGTAATRGSEAAGRAVGFSGRTRQWAGPQPPELAFLYINTTWAPPPASLGPRGPAQHPAPPPAPLPPCPTAPLRGGGIKQPSPACFLPCSFQANSTLLTLVSLKDPLPSPVLSPVCPFQPRLVPNMLFLQICSCPSYQQAFLSPLGSLGTHPAHPVLFCMLFL